MKKVLFTLIAATSIFAQASVDQILCLQKVGPTECYTAVEKNTGDLQAKSYCRVSLEFKTAKQTIQEGIQRSYSEANDRAALSDEMLANAGYTESATKTLKQQARQNTTALLQQNLGYNVLSKVPACKDFTNESTTTINLKHDAFTATDSLKNY